jgi:hypothetical protein
LQINLIGYPQTFKMESKKDMEKTIYRRLKGEDDM